MNESIHKSVLSQEVLEYLNLKPGMQIIDATLNGAGHTRMILEHIGPDGQVLGIEWDKDLAAKASAELAEFGNRVIVVNDSYVNMAIIAKEHNIHPDGILFDLGLSSWHYEQSGRGFSFKRDEPLDMRFNTETSLTAAQIVNTCSEDELVALIRDYGEEQFAKQIASAITEARREAPITTTARLVQIIEGAVPVWYTHRRIHCATKTFQALRVMVNDELGNVEKGVRAAIDLLKPGGRVVVISFQGHEDKLVRELFKKYKAEGIIKMPKSGTIRPKWSEQEENRRSRSAKMKVAEKI
ncbi:16S rRNA (cytosine(1402)-N(4))-methyltransferase RsmH [Candidatus Parcubacteria bacterium]|nr:16S rRNA (cytosine(1402)-N(4))-methyltransferase RsmH [Candidatus Parcubacteria bacterium]